MTKRVAARRALRALVSVLATLVLVVSSSAAPVGAVDDLGVESTSTFVANTGLRLLEVEHEFTITNERPPLVTDTQIEEFFFTEFAFVLLAAAADIEVAADGEILSIQADAVPGSRAFDLVTVTLPERLAYEESMTIDVRYVVRSGEARSDDPVRITSSYVAFPVYACCDPGRAAVRVLVPSQFELSLEGENADLAQIVLGDTRILTATEIENPLSFNAFVFGRNDDGLGVTRVDVGGSIVQIESWLDDPEWSAFAERWVGSLIPALVEEIGQPWPVTTDLRVVETTTPYLFGYAAWYRHRTGVIEIGEQLDETVLAHELTHAWFSDSLFESRWINEGLAEYFGQRALHDVAGIAGTNPPPAPLPDPPGSFFARPLNEWARPIGEQTQLADELENFGYEASYFVIDQIAQQIGHDKLAEIIADAQSGEISFVAGDQVEGDLNAWRSWQRFMDLVQERGGWSGVDDFFNTWVLTDEDKALLPERREALARYDSFVTDLDAWSAPLGVRSALTLWEFDEVETLISQAEQVSAKSDEIAATAASLNLPVLPIVQDAFEASQTSEDLDATRLVAQRQIDTLAEVQAATDLVANATDWSVEVGLRGTDVNAALEDVRTAYRNDEQAMAQAIVSEMRTALAEAPQAGRRTALLVMLLSGGVVALVIIWWSGRRRKRKEAAPRLFEAVR